MSTDLEDLKNQFEKLSNEELVRTLILTVSRIVLLEINDPNSDRKCVEVEILLLKTETLRRLNINRSRVKFPDENIERALKECGLDREFLKG